MSINGDVQTCSSSIASICLRFESGNNVRDDARGAEPNLLRLTGPLFKALPRIGLKHVGVLMQIGREKQELPMLHLELPRRLIYPAFAEQQNLPAILQGGADDRPFLEGNVQ